MAKTVKGKGTGGIFAPSTAQFGLPGAGVDTSYMPAGTAPAPGEYGGDPTPVDPGGSYSGGSSGGGGAAYDPTTDPTYQAYISNLDLQLAQQQQNTERQRAQLLGNQDQQLYDTAQAGDQSRTGISGNYESRGLFNSGGRLRDIAQQQADQGTRESRIRQGTATGISDLENALAQAQAHATLLKQGASQGVFQ